MSETAVQKSMRLTFWSYIRIEMVINDLLSWFFFSFFIIYITVKLFMTDSEWFTVPLKTPTPQANVWNKAPPRRG